MLQSEFYMQDGGFALSDAGFAGGHEDNPAQHTCYQGNGGGESFHVLTLFIPICFTDYSNPLQMISVQF